MTLHEINSVRLLVVESGEGEPLVLVHGSWDDRRVWEQVEPELAGDFRVINYDRRGHTGSEDSAEPGTRRDDEDDLAALIETLGPAPANVVANSFGASIALGLATRRPELFRALCAHEPPLLSIAADDPALAGIGEVVGPVLELIERGAFEDAARQFIETIAVGPGAWAQMPAEARAMVTANAPTFAGEQLDPAWADIDLAALAGVDFPVLLTGGSESPPFFAAILARLAEAIDGAELRTLQGAGHIPHETQPAEYAALVKGFLGTGA